MTYYDFGGNYSPVIKCFDKTGSVMRYLRMGKIIRSVKLYVLSDRWIFYERVIAFKIISSGIMDNDEGINYFYGGFKEFLRIIINSSH